MLENPMDLTLNKVVISTDKKILNTGAVELKNVWKGFCNCGEQTASTNPFITGQKGQLRVWKNWTYLTSRSQTQTNGELNIRYDGWIEDYSSFWNYDVNRNLMNPFYYSYDGTNNTFETNYTATDILKKWQFVTEIENYNPIGQEIENKDALNRFSMAQFGYGRNLPVGVSNNSKYNESGFDGFEDYLYNDCNDDHFSWRKAIGTGTGETSLSGQAHTGRNAILVQPNQKVGLTKQIKTNCDN
jgi:hypothetical protein